jgi:hypothetical protein
MMKPSGILRAAAVLAAVAVLLPQCAESFQKKQPSSAKKPQDQFLNGGPFTFDQLLRLIRENVISQRRQKEAIQNRGLDFSLSPDDVDKLKAAGASDEMLALISERAKPQPVKPPPPKPRPKQGGLLITCAPAECEVTIGGAPKGPTSGGVMRISGLPLGSTVVDFSKPGYVGFQSALTVEADKITPVTATLEPDRATKEALGAELFKSVIQALGGAQAVRAALSMQAEGSLTTWTPDGKSTRWTIFVRNNPDRGLLQLKGGGSVFHEVAYLGSKFTTSKSLKGDDARELPTDFGWLRDYRLPTLIARLSTPKFKMLSNSASKIAGQDLVLTAEGSTETISVSLDNDLRPAQVRFGTATGLGAGIVTYSDYTKQGAAYHPQSMQIKPDATPHGIEVHFDKLELDPKLKDSDYDLKKKPLPSLSR